MVKYLAGAVRSLKLVVIAGFICACAPFIARAQDPGASLAVADLLPDGSALLPLQDWEPLFQFTITTSEPSDPPVGTPGRVLARLDFDIKSDPKGGDRTYDILSEPLESDILEFAIFQEGGDPETRGALDTDDFIVTGRGGTPLANVPLIFDVQGNLTSSPFTNIDGDPAPLQFKLGKLITAFQNFIEVDPATAQQFIVAVRTSATWRNGVTLAYDSPVAEHASLPGTAGAAATDWELLLPNGTVPTDAANPGPPANPDQYPTDPLDPETAYCSSFAAWDISSGPSTNIFNSEFENAWAHPRFLYTPPSEYIRVRPDVGPNVVDFVAGEFVGIRRLIPLEQWSPLIGLNMHSTGTAYNGQQPILKEVNVILTDIGADPNGPAGNGGLNPIQGLETFTDIGGSFGGDEFDGDTAVSRDFSFNGLWVFFDTNGNGVFDQPQPIAGGGVSFIDHPMFPEGFDDLEASDNRNPGIGRWEYMPLPPDGGDPWWKIRLRFSNLGRRQDLPLPDPLPDPRELGWLAAGPNGDRNNFPTSEFCDYFVVARPDSGFEDSQLLPGDGVGMTYGADFRAFIEPRRFNPNSGHTDGGVFVASQIPRDSLISDGVYFSAAWQDDALWGATEPWWPGRTLNQTNAKPVRATMEIHDLVLTYESSNLYSRLTDINYGRGMYLGAGTFGIPGLIPEFSAWLDPTLARAGLYADVHAVGVRQWFTDIAGVDEHLFNANQYAYETVPFFQPANDLPPFGPRSGFLPTPPAQPALPDYSTWPATLGPGEFPREIQWAAPDRRGRVLKQHIEPNSEATAMIGINLVAADDPITNKHMIGQGPNGNQVVPLEAVQQITVAFWGPDFKPSDLRPVTLDGTGNSGVALYEDGVPDTGQSTVVPQPYVGQNGVFGGPDSVVPLLNLKWKTDPELIDINGDGTAEDMNLDGSITDADKCWVLQMRPAKPWPLPTRDAEGGFFPTGTSQGGTKALNGSTNPEGLVPEPLMVGLGAAQYPPDDEYTGAAKNDPARTARTFSKRQPIELTDEDLQSNNFPVGPFWQPGEKAFGPAGNAGDDLFIVVQTSNSIGRFEQFRCVVPSRLPDRGGQVAGIQLNPQVPISLAIYDKSEPEEGVFPFYGPEPFGFDLIEANVYSNVSDISNGLFTIGGTGTAVLGIDLSTNRGDAGLAASGTTGTGGPASFNVGSASWPVGGFAGYFLIDKNFTQWRITTNTAKKLTLNSVANASGTPASGAWKIVKDPTFLEQLIVEFYDGGNDGQFSLINDLKPFTTDPVTSGIALYRDNDNDPDNINGEFDDTDLPVQLDYAPFQTGQAGEVANQVMLIFSTPGTDAIPVATANQTRHRQWVPDSIGENSSDPEKGDDFFVVIRPSDDIEAGDDFRVGIVPWGPNTPTEPDPDTFPPPPASRTGEFDIFSEFPWGQRAIGLITFFTEKPYYSQYPVEDVSGFDWVRSTTAKSEVTGTITAAVDTGNANSLKITGVVPGVLPKNITGDGITLFITGQNFGSSPQVSLDGVSLAVVNSSATSITAIIPGGTTLDSDSDTKITLRVTNPANGDFDTYKNLEVDPTGTGGGTAPKITSISPNQGTKTDFPVTITGTNFSNPTVTFEGVIMPIQGTPTATQIKVAFPVGGLPFTGPLDVQVKNSNGLLDIKPDGFKYINSPTGGGGGTGGGGFGGGGGLPVGGCFIATAAYGSPFAAHLDTFRGFRDSVLLKTAPGTALVETYYTVSPALADGVAAHPALAFLVRLLLTPIAWALEAPLMAAATILIPGVGLAMRARGKKRGMARRSR